MGQRDYLIGQKRTEQTRRNISNSLKGKYSGDKNPFYGKKHSEETKEKIRKSRGRRLWTGENSENWKGGTEGWYKNQAKLRDNYTCQKCGLKDDDIMVVDHIKPKSIYPELYKELSNLQTLCPNCHARKTINEQIDIMRIKKAKI